MPSQSSSIEINASAHQVFTYVNDPTTLAEWLPNMVEVRDVIGAGEGQQYDWTYKYLGLLFSGQSVVVEYVADEHSVHQSIGKIESTWTYRVRTDGDRATLEIEIEYGVPISVLGRLAESVVATRDERNLKLGLANVKEMMER